MSFNLSEEHSKFASLGSKTRKPFYQLLRSLIMNGELYGGIPFHQIHKLQLVKVLDLGSHEVGYFSSATLIPLNHLKYLAVWAKNFYFHPESHLPHLETLIVKSSWGSIVVLPAYFWEMEKLRHVEIAYAKFDCEEYKQRLFEGSSKLENLRILKNIVELPIDNGVDVLSRRCPNLQQLNIEFWESAPASFCLTLENLTQLQILHICFHGPYTVPVFQSASNLKKLVLGGTHFEIPFLAGLASLEYLQLRRCLYSEEWCLGDITFPKLKLLKLVRLGISRWDASEESFPLLETLIISACDDLKEIPLSFADIPTLKQIKLIWCKNKSLEDSAERIKKDVEENEGCDRIDLIIKNY